MRIEIGIGVRDGTVRPVHIDRGVCPASSSPIDIVAPRVEFPRFELRRGYTSIEGSRAGPRSVRQVYTTVSLAVGT